MATQEQILSIIKKIKKDKPTDIFKKILDMDSGIRFVLTLLYESDAEVYASTISEKMNISRARVAVLLKKMQDKNLILKTPSEFDARIEIVSFTKYGLDCAKKFREQSMSMINKVVDNLGYENVNNFIDMAINIKKILD